MGKNILAISLIVVLLIGVISFDNAYAAEKIEVCHDDKTKKIKDKDLQKHLDHGDTEGACPTSHDLITMFADLWNAITGLQNQIDTIESTPGEPGTNGISALIETIQSPVGCDGEPGTLYVFGLDLNGDGMIGNARNDPEFVAAELVCPGANGVQGEQGPQGIQGPQGDPGTGGTYTAGSGLILTGNEFSFDPTQQSIQFDNKVGRQPFGVENGGYGYVANLYAERSQNAVTATTAQNADSATIAQSVADNSITSASVVGGALSGHDIKNESITSSDILDGTITSSDIRDRSITTIDFANEAVGSLAIKNGAITGEDIKSETITSIDILDGTIKHVDVSTKTIYSDFCDHGRLTTSSSCMHGTLGSVNNAVVGYLIAK